MQADGCHFLIKSKAYFSDVELFSSDLTQRDIFPLTDATKKPLLYFKMTDMAS
jgi:hypothetical protein